VFQTALKLFYFVWNRILQTIFKFRISNKYFSEKVEGPNHFRNHADLTKVMLQQSSFLGWVDDKPKILIWIKKYFKS
jgi:hypothetical protein